MPSDPSATVRAGSLLVSSLGLTEPTFRRTVVFVIEHSPEGSLGVVLNRPSTTGVDEALPAWSTLAARPSALFVGGPVTRTTALCLATTRIGTRAGPVAGLRTVQGRVVLVDLDVDPGSVADVVDGVRVFVGYAGWSGGQLDDELARGDWWVTPSIPSDVLSAGRTDLWAQVLRRQPLPLAMLATHPLDTSRN